MSPLHPHKVGHLFNTTNTECMSPLHPHKVGHLFNTTNTECMSPLHPHKVGHLFNTTNTECMSPLHPHKAGHLFNTTYTEWYSEITLKCQFLNNCNSPVLRQCSWHEVSCRSQNHKACRIHPCNKPSKKLSASTPIHTSYYWTRKTGLSGNLVCGQERE